jgi:hypothetical protein
MCKCCENGLVASGLSVYGGTCFVVEYTQEVKQRYAEIFPNLTILETGSVADTTLTVTVN